MPRRNVRLEAQRAEETTNSYSTSREAENFRSSRARLSRDFDGQGRPVFVFSPDVPGTLFLNRIREAHSRTDVSKKPTARAASSRRNLSFLNRLTYRSLLVCYFTWKTVAEQERPKVSARMGELFGGEGLRQI